MQLSIKTQWLILAFGFWIKTGNSQPPSSINMTNYPGRSWLGDHVSRDHVQLSHIGKFPFMFKNEEATNKTILVADPNKWSFMQSDGTICHNQAYYCPQNHIIPIASCVIKYDTMSCNRLFLPCKSDEFMCRVSRMCLPRYAVRDKHNDCVTVHPTDMSDEEKAFNQCLENEFRCNNSGRCIPRDWVMDGIPDCDSKRSIALDEASPLEKCNFAEFRCKGNGRCIKRYHVMDSFIDCSDKSDEFKPLIFCNNETEFRCGTSGRCIPRSWMMDGVTNCEDGSDEQWRVMNHCHKKEFRCHNGRRCLADIYLCDGIDNCGDCSDEIESCDHPAMMRCAHDPNNTCVPFSLCNGINQCPLMRTYHPRSFKCKVNLKYDNCDVAQWMLGGDVSVCYDQSDSCSAKNQCLACSRNGTRIARKQLCNGIMDCQNLSDECLCITKNNVFNKVCEQICEHCQECKIGEITCPLEKKCLKLNQICDGKVDCIESKMDEKYCNDLKRTFIDTLITVGPPMLDNDLKCEGEIEDHIQQICNHALTSTFQTLHGNYTKKSCEGFNSEDIPLYHGDTCNGYVQCRNEIDEKFCPQQIRCVLPGSFEFNENVLYIPMQHQCNGIIDCMKSTDEVNCNQSTHFYCHNKKPLFVPLSNVRNGKKECDDNSDECSLESFSLTFEPLSSPDEMIDNKFLRGLLWIISAAAIIGNAIVIDEIIALLKSSTSTSSMRKCNQILLINLATADLIMGIGLMIMAFKSALMSGNYCALEREWRTSNLCNVIGVLIVISSKASVYTLVVLTIYRLYGVMRPFQSNHINIKKLGFILSILWIFAIGVGIYPLVPGLNEHFLTHVYIKESVYFDTTSVPWKDMKTFASRLFILNRNKSMEYDLKNWQTTIDQIQTHFKDQAPKVLGYFGYYSSHGVCIPRFFRYDGNSSPLHPLSLLITGFTFLSIMFIAISYVTIFYKSTSNHELNLSSANQDKNNSEMMKRVTILIATDFSCWFPICMMTLLSQAGVSIPPGAYAASAIVVLPINSCLNPVIYSSCFSKTRKKFASLCKMKMTGKVRNNNVNSSSTEQSRVKNLRSVKDTTVTEVKLSNISISR